MNIFTNKGSVRKFSIAEQAGLKEGDLVISINNKKVTDLDHDQVVRLVGLSKNKLILQVTKIKSSFNDISASLNNKETFESNLIHENSILVCSYLHPTFFCLFVFRQ
jgi:hypothetical protein